VSSPWRTIARHAVKGYGRFAKGLQRRLHSRELLEEYGSHLPVLGALCELFPPRVALEFGMGMASTPYLLDHAQLLVSVECDRTWYKKTLRQIGPAKECFAPVLWPDEEPQGILALLGTQVFDLALIDGRGRSRVPCARMLLGRCRFMVLHDVDGVFYKWEEFFSSAEVVGHEHFFFSRRRLPWTAVVAADKGDLSRVVEACGDDVDEIDRFYAAVR
jgi:hypothetical protein